MKKERRKTLRSSWAQELLLGRSTHRAGAGAGAAVDAYVRINFVDVAFGNRSDRAFVETSTASYAVLCDFVSHKFMSLK